jgi:hypothetical protein
MGTTRRPSYLTQTEPTVLHGRTWYWVVAGRQFLCSFLNNPKDKERARLALLRYVQESLPEPNDDSRLVQGPCCVPEGGDFPRPLPAEESEDE